MALPVERSRDSAESLPVFVVLWSIATLFHQASVRAWAASPLDLLLTAAALFALLRPGSLGRLALLAAAQVAGVVDKLPQVSNHWHFTAFVNLTILLALARARGQVGRGLVDRGRLFEDLAGPIRVQLVLMYLWAAFHKLNYDYLDPQVSCAATFSQAIAAELPFVPSGLWASRAAMWGSLLTEALIPVFLVVPRLRVPGIAIGVLFHLALSLSPHPPQRVYNFSAMVLAVYFLFTPPGLIAGVRSWWRESKLRAWLPAEAALRELSPWAFGALLATLVGAVTFGAASPAWTSTVSWGGLVAWFVYALVAFALLVLARPAEAAGLGASELVRVGSPILLLGPALVLLSGLSPYLGGRTESSFSMYSNLRTEGGATNHLIWRRPLRLLGYQEDLVSIRASSNSKLAWYAETGHVMTWFEFRDFVGRRPRLEVTYRRGSEPERTFTRPEDDPRLTPRRPWLRKLLLFRPAKVEGPVDCIH